MKTEHCRSCGAPVVWANHAGTGRPAPIDAAPYPGGNVILIDSPGGAHYRTAQFPRDAHTPTHRSHFATCPHARSWRGDHEPSAA